MTATAQPLRLFLVTIGARNAPRIQLEAYARSSVDVTAQHICLALENERIEVRQKAMEARNA